MPACLIDQVILAGADKHPVVKHLRLGLVLNGVRGNGLDHAVQPAVNGVVVGGDFDQRLLVRMDKSDITRREAGFDQQVIVHWHDLHQLAVGRDHAADGGDLDVFHDPAHRRFHRQAGDGILAALEDRRNHIHFRVGLGERLARLDVILRTHVGELQLQIAFLPLQAQHLHVAGGPCLYQPLGNGQLFVSQI